MLFTGMNATSQNMAKAEDYICNVDILEGILTETTGGLTMYPSTELDQVYPGVYIGEESSIKTASVLQKAGVTHILNAAEGESGFHVTPDLDLYTRMDITYKGIRATDDITYPLHNHFEEAAEFIDQALSKNGVVLVNCVCGVSRSTTLTVAFLMLRRHLSATEALREVRSHREVAPNDSFLQMLCDLDKELRSRGHYDQKDPRKTGTL